MFTGIIEALGRVIEVRAEGSNKSFWIESPISAELKPDQSVSHNGVCLTVEEVSQGRHRVTAIAETLKKTNLEEWEPGSGVNLERCLTVNSRLDGHFVQGHVDARGRCRKRVEKDGSWEFTIEFPKKFAALVIEKGSIAVNGISLTAFNVKKRSFDIAIIPFTFAHTNIGEVEAGSEVNLEFDMVGKYIQRKLTIG
jgi:riboflavin synthase